MSYSWNVVDEEARKEIFERFPQLHDLSLFPPDLTRIEKRIPRFYKKFYHFRVTNYAGTDGPSFKFISNGEDYYFLDGTPKAIYEASKKDGLELTKEHVIAYLAYFLRNVQGQHGDMDLVINKDRSCFITHASRDERERILEREHGIDVEYNEDENVFTASGTLFYNDEFVPAVFSITKDGIVSIQSNGREVKIKS